MGQVMRFVRSSILGAGALLAFSSVAAADGDWQTVSLEDDPGITIDVPAVVGKDYLPDDKHREQGDVMFFAVTTDNGGDLSCLLSRTKYGKMLGPKDAAAKLASATRNLLCTGGDGAVNITVGESRSLISNGFPAGECAASYTDSKDKNSGWISSVLAVAAPQAFYQLTCEVRTVSQDQAQAEWVLHWSGEVAHIRQSLHLPAEK